MCLTITQPNLKGQERSDRAGSTTSLQKHIGEIRQKMPQGKNYQKFRSNTQKKSQLLKKCSEYLTHENTQKYLMGHTTLNMEKDTLLILQPQQQSLFTSNQEEIDTRIALHGSDGSKPVLVKAKDTDISILMVHAFALTSPPYGWYLQIHNGKVVNVKRIYQNFGKTTSLYLPQFHSLTGCDTIRHFFGISKTCFPTIAEGYICYRSH